MTAQNLCTTECAMLPPEVIQAEVVEHPGVTWWNDLTDGDRLFWCNSARTSVPADAWFFYLRQEGLFQ